MLPLLTTGWKKWIYTQCWCNSGL